MSNMNKRQPVTIKSINVNGILDYVGDDKIVKVSDGITKISGNAFRNCPSLEELYLPSTIFELVPNCFNYCHNLSFISMKLPKNILLPLFGTEEKYNNYVKNHRNYKLKNLKI